MLPWDGSGDGSAEGMPGLLKLSAKLTEWLLEFVLRSDEDEPFVRLPSTPLLSPLVTVLPFPPGQVFLLRTPLIAAAVGRDGGSALGAIDASIETNVVLQGGRKTKQDNSDGLAKGSRWYR